MRWQLDFAGRAQFCVRFKVLDPGGNERGYLREVDVPANVVPRAELTLLHAGGKSTCRKLDLKPDC